jgi:hypothetical protein
MTERIGQVLGLQLDNSSQQQTLNIPLKKKKKR